MPIVKSHTTAFRQADGTRFMMRIYCSANGRFTIRLPDETHAVLGQVKVGADRMEEAVREYHRAMGAFESSQQRTEKVIVYKVLSNSYIFDPDGTCIRKTDDISFCAGTAVSVAAAVYEKTTTARADGSEMVRYTRQPSSIPRGLQNLDKVLVTPQSNELPWTENREEFFRVIGQSMEALILRLTDLCDDPKRLAEAASRLNANLLALPFHDAHQD